MAKRLAILFVLFIVGAGRADAAFELCNDTDEELTTAFGYPESGGWYAEGWWILDAGECKIVYGEQLINRYYYVYAKGDDGARWNGQATFCVQSKVFTLLNGRCAGPGQRKESFAKVDIGGKVLDHFTLTLTGRDRAWRGEDFTVDLAPAINSDAKLRSEIAAICQSVCQGNAKRSWMHAAILNVRPNATFSTGMIDLRLRNRHTWSGRTTWSHTEEVQVYFRVHNVSCRVKVTRVSASSLIGNFAIELTDGLFRLFSNNEATLADQFGQHRICP